MLEVTLGVCFLGIIAVSLLVVAVSIALAAADAHTVLRKVALLLPRADEALEEAARSLHHARGMLAKLNRTTGYVETTVHHAHNVLAEAFDQFAHWRQQITSVFSDHAGNGARAEPRRYHRS